jgi:IclR family acetate operon transcriptional repressor
LPASGAAHPDTIANRPKRERGNKVAESEKLNDSVRAVDRALEILLAFTPTDHALSAGELLKRVDLSRPTLYRLLRTLEQSGFVRSVGEPQRFRLGPAVARLAHVWTATQDISALAQPMMQRLRERTGETVALFVPQGLHRVCVAELPSSQPLSFKRGVGYSERIVVGASGRAILAHTVLGDKDLRAYAAGTKVNLSGYPKELEAIRKRGYATSRDELLQGAVAIAAPYFDGSGEVAGSIAVFGPSARIHAAEVEAIGKLLVEEAQALSKALGQP